MMADAGGEILAVHGALLLAGLAGSLHCVGMCGPILIAFSQAFRVSETGPARGLFSDFVLYHAGRIWTYGLLGVFAGFAGEGLRDGALIVGWQKGASYAVGGLVVLVGLLLSGILPATKLEKVLAGCGVGRMREWRWFSTLLHHRGKTARLLLGAVMGLLPCGLVYAMLVVVAALPGPLWAGLGMVVFGVGTLPALTAVLAASRTLSAWIRSHGTRVVAVALIAGGLVMLARTAMVTPGAHEHGHSSSGIPRYPVTEDTSRESSPSR